MHKRRTLPKSFSFLFVCKNLRSISSIALRSISSLLLLGGDEMRESKKIVETASDMMNEPSILSAEEYTHGGVRKTKFAPKVPTRRLKKLSEIKRDGKESADNSLSSELQLLLKQSQEDTANKRGNKFDSKGSTPARVAFGFGSSTAGRAGSSSYGFHKTSSGGGGGGGGSGSGHNASEKKPSIRKVSEPEVFDGRSQKARTSFPEPMDNSKDYPLTLPFSGATSSVLHDDVGDADSFDEDAVTPAKELELMVEDMEERLLFFQLPSTLPISKMSSVSVDGEDNKGPEGEDNLIGAPTSLDKVPSGLLGKILVYESGTVKLKVGDVVLDALPGVECAFAQELAAINTSSRHCCFLGDVTQRVILTPDIDSLLHQ